MFVRKKKHRSGHIGIIIAEKIGGRMKELTTIGVAHSEDEVESLMQKAKEWILREKSTRYPQLDLFQEKAQSCYCERQEVQRILSNVSNILLNGCDSTLVGWLRILGKSLENCLHISKNLTNFVYKLHIT